MTQLYGVEREQARDGLSFDSEELSYLSKALYVVEGDADVLYMLEADDSDEDYQAVSGDESTRTGSVKKFLRNYGLSEQETELVYEAARPATARNEEHVFERLASAVDDDETPEYRDPGMSELFDYFDRLSADPHQ